MNLDNIQVICKFNLKDLAIVDMMVTQTNPNFLYHSYENWTPYAIKTIFNIIFIIKFKD